MNVSAPAVHTHGGTTHSHGGGGSPHAHAAEGMRAVIPGSYYMHVESGSTPATTVAPPTRPDASGGGSGYAYAASGGAQIPAGMASFDVAADGYGTGSFVPPTATAAATGAGDMAGMSMSMPAYDDASGGGETNDLGEPIGADAAPEPDDMQNAEGYGADMELGVNDNPVNGSGGTADAMAGGSAAVLGSLAEVLQQLVSVLTDLVTAIQGMIGGTVDGGGDVGGKMGDKDPMQGDIAQGGGDMGDMSAMPPAAGEVDGVMGDMSGMDDASGGGGMGDMDMGPVAAPEGMSVSMTATRDAMSGYNLMINTEGFDWAPDSVNSAHQAGEGHAHLYIDGEKAGRLYGPAHHITGLTPGEHEIKVVLNGNHHGAYQRDGEDIAATATVTF